jgi:FxsC-like protein
VLYFFLSYAREDDPEYIRRFFHDLSSQVRNLAGVGKEDVVGFLDEQSLQIGQRWSMELADALSSCRCFVAMTSPRYFRRDYCGREWAVFSDRLVAYERRWNRRAPALLPVRWIPTSPMHPLAAEIQNTNPGIGADSYQEYGLRQMLDLKRFRDDYRSFVFDLARQIVLVADAHDIPRSRHLVPLERVRNVFLLESAADGSRETGTPSRESGGKAHRLSARTLVHFIVVAGNRDEMSAIRSKLDYYGSSRVDWAPYRPGLDEALAALAAQVADDRMFESEIADIAELADRVDQARRGNELVVLLVDAWAPGLADHRRALLAYDANDELTSAVMIPFNSGDGETLADTTILQAQLANVLPHVLERRDRVMLRQNIPTAEQFSSNLEEILEVAQNRIFKKGAVNAQVHSGAVGTRPILEGPTSTLDGNPS